MHANAAAAAVSLHVGPAARRVLAHLYLRSGPAALRPPRAHVLPAPAPAPLPLPTALAGTAATAVGRGFLLRFRLAILLVTRASALADDRFFVQMPMHTCESNK